jgi:hypothetical protein
MDLHRLANNEMAKPARVSVSENLYNPGTTYPAVAESAVQVYWHQPPFEVVPIGEMRIRPCPACSDDRIASKVRPRAAALGADVVVIVDESRRVTGGYVAGSTVGLYEKRRLIAIMGRRKQ